ncbi:hypothetical protein [Flavobacteriaceae bacterium 14752]|uniref:hypothetical protein n=1 Tax=Mesohalobacter salilacus TaxID=2491711 RepID=UPI000F6333B7|nr:hypothetical protein EIG84_03495 [Flavobacteriaceae bacterium 14752]
MKNIILILVLMFYSASFAQSQFEFDFNAFELKLNQNENLKIHYNFQNKKDANLLNTNSLNEIFNTKKPLNSSTSYSILVDNSKSFHSNSLDVNFNKIDKKFFKNPYEGYQNDLSKFLPQVPDLNSFCTY